MTHRGGRALLALVFGVSAVVAALGQTVGETSYLEGVVAVYRGGTRMDGRRVDVGMAVENYDIVQTGDDGTLEVLLTAGPSPDTTIRVDPDTSFTIEVGRIQRRPATTFDILSGTLAFKVQRISGSGTVDVRTDTAVMAVRGTDFTVTSPPSGDVLVTVSDGEVVCTDEVGVVLRALPGSAVEKIAGQRMRSIPVAVSTLESFRSQWLAERIEALRANALRAIQDNATRYLELSRRFNEQYRDLMAESAILDAWAAEDRRGVSTEALSARTLAQKKRLIGPLFRLRATLFIFERVYFRLNELERYHREGFGRGRLADGTTTAVFFTRTAGERRDLAERLSRVQNAARAYAARNDGEFPAGLLGDQEGE